MKAPDIRYHPGWRYAFTREEARQALYKNGTRVKKKVSEEGDAHTLGALATVLGSVYIPPPPGYDLAAQMAPSGVGYFLEWDDTPKTAAFVVEWKLSAA